MNRVVVVAGVPGPRKSTIVDGALQKAETKLLKEAKGRVK